MSRINSVYRIVQALINKENRGYLTPDEFNNLAKQAQNEILDGYFYDLNFHLRKQVQGGVGSMYSDIPMQIREKIDRLVTFGADLTVTDGTADLPDDLLKIITVVYNDTTNLAMTDPQNLRYLLGSPNAQPSEAFPVFLRHGDSINIYPIAIRDNVTIDYIRKPEDPQWTYNTVNGSAMFNQNKSNYQDFEIHESDDHELVEKILMYAGITIQRDEIVNYAIGDIDRDNQKENS